MQIAVLDFTIIQLNAEKVLSSHVNDILAEKLDDLQQFTRRPCIVMEGIPVNKGETVEQVENSAKEVLKDNLGFTEETVLKEFDKAH